MITEASPSITPGSDEKRRYWAFLSYSHRDTRWAKKIHASLERYRVPRRLVGVKSLFGCPVPRRIFPVFLDEAELPTSADLNNNLTEALELSHTLVVIASPAAGKSHWVNQEVIHYKKIGGAGRVMAIIVDGEPHADDNPDWGKVECFPKALRRVVLEDGTVTEERVDPLAADVRPLVGLRWRKARLKLIAGIVGLKFDELERRDLQRLRLRIAMWTTSVMAVLFAFVMQHQQAETRRRAEQAQAHLAKANQYLASKNFMHAGAELLEAFRGGIAPEVMRPQLTAVAKAFIPMSDILPSATRNLESVDFSADGKQLAVAGYDGRTSVWEIRPEGALLSGRRNLSRRSAAQVVFHPDGNRVATSFWDGTVQVWNFRDGSAPVICNGHVAKIRVGTVDIDRSGTAMATGGDDTFVKLWNGDGAAWQMAQTPLAEHDNTVKGARFSPDGSLLATVGFDGMVKIFAMPGGAQVASFPVKDELNRVAISHDNKQVITAGRAGSIWIFDLTERRLLKEIPRAHASRINDVVTHPDGKTYFTAGDDGYVRRWRLSDHELENSIEEHGPLRPALAGTAVKILSVAVSDDGKLAASSGDDGVVKIWNLSTTLPASPDDVLNELFRRAGGWPLIQ